MGVWAGNTDHSPMIRIDGITGAAPIFYHSMLYAERNLPQRPFPVPPGVHRAPVTSNGITTTDWVIGG
jgi:membrane carboxypeptidase/penicillin-binding protein PbpC